jgi:glycosyltransferase involved in cell wall biosynthesis
MGIAPDQFVFLSFGQIRPYKRVSQLIATIRGLPRDVALIVAGSATDEIGAEIRQAAGNDERIKLHIGYVDDQQVATYFTIADAAVLNYERLLNSAVLSLSLGYSLPAVVPYEGTEDIARLPGGDDALERFRPGGLAQAMLDMVQSEPERRRSAAHQIARSFSWDAFVDGLVRAYRGP